MGNLNKSLDIMENKLKYESFFKRKRGIELCVYCKHYKSIPGNTLCTLNDTITNDIESCVSFELNRDEFGEMQKKFCYLCNNSYINSRKNHFSGLYCRILPESKGSWISEANASNCNSFELYR